MCQNACILTHPHNTSTLTKPIMKVFYLLIFLFVSFGGFAQESDFNRKKLMKEIKESVKAENYSKADKQIGDAMAKHPEVRTDAELYNMWMNANYDLALAENRKIYLANNPDTLKYMEYIYKMYAYGLKCDSLEGIPNEKNKIKRKYRKNISAKFNFFRKNFENAGKYFYNKKNYKLAYSYIDMYISSESKCGEIIAAASDGKKQTKMSADLQNMNVLAVLSAYATANYDAVIKYLPVALNDSSKRAYLLEIGCKSYQQLLRTDDYVALLDEGFSEFPKNDYFYASLIKHYNERNDFAKALTYTLKMTELCPENYTYWYVKGKEERFLNMLDSAIISYERVLQIKNDEAETYASLGDIYIIKAQRVDAELTVPATDPQYAEKKRLMTEYYTKACDYYEKARHYNGENTALWLAGLKEAYFKLNKGKELRKLEQIKTK